MNEFSIFAGFHLRTENDLMKYLLRAKGIYYGLTIFELVTMTYEFAKKIGVPYPVAWDVQRQALNNWYIKQ